jgi:hypothetical protein
MVIQVCNPSTWQAKAGGSIDQDYLGLQSELKDSLHYKEKSCLKQPEKQMKKTE